MAGDTPGSAPLNSERAMSNPATARFNDDDDFDPASILLAEQHARSAAQAYEDNGAELYEEDESGAALLRERPKRGDFVVSDLDGFFTKVWRAIAMLSLLPSWWLTQWPAVRCIIIIRARDS